MISHPAAVPPSSSPITISNTAMTTTATTVEPPSPAAAADVKPDPQYGLKNLIGHYVFAVLFLLGCFTTMACSFWSESRAAVAVAGVMFCYSMVVSLLIISYWDKREKNELAAGSGCRIMVRLSLLTVMMFISLVIMALLLRPDWRYPTFVVAVFLGATVFLLGFVSEEEWREKARETHSGAACPQEKTLEQV